MNTRIITPLLFGVFCLAGCSPRVTTTLIKAKAPLESEEQVTILDQEAPKPEKAVPVQVIKAIGPDYYPLVAKIRSDAAEAGANVVKIEDYFQPDIASSRHRIAALTYWADDSVNPDSVRVDKARLKDELNINKGTGSLRASISGGVAYVTAKIPDNLSNVEKTHQQNMKLGATVDAEVSYFFGESAGLGVRYHNFFSGDQMPMSVKMSDGSIQEGYLKNNVSIWFVGPAIRGRFLTPSRNQALLLSYAFGAAGEVDRGDIMSVPYKIKGWTLGHLFELGYDLRIARNFTLGASLYYMLGTIRDCTVYDGTGKSQSMALTEDNFEHLGHVGLSIGLRYNL